MGKQNSGISDEIFALYEKLISINPTLERKGKTTPYASLNGHMFRFLTKEGGLALRLPKETRETFIAEHKTELCV